MTSASRLPGVYFETILPSPGGTLPRMDIAAFAGFAASGPLDVPVAVEDAVRFQEIFGQDLTLAWDPAHNRTVYAQLPSAIRAFFRNGGRRCWIVRIADQPKLNTFAIPGVLRALDTFTTPATAIARSEGSWSDRMSVNATITQRPLAITGLTVKDVVPAEMVRLTYSSLGAVAFIPVPPAAASEYGTRKQIPRSVTLDPSTGYWFQSASASDFPVTTGVASGYQFQVSNGQLMFRVGREEASSFAVGSMVKLSLTGGLIGTKGSDLWVQVGDTNSGHGPGASGDVWVVARQAWWPLPTAAIATIVASPTPPQAAVVSLELWARDQASGVARLSDLGFVPEHPRFWAYLPTDQDLFTPSRQPRTLPGEALRQIADHPRFPLAAPAGADVAVYLPLGIDGAPDDDFYQGASVPAGTPLERDGLANLSQTLFVDPDLAGSGAATLLDAAFFKQYQQGIPLTRMHALMSIEQASLFAVPDASQAAWEKVTQIPVVLEAPHLNPVASPDAAGNAAATWTAVSDAISYELQQSAEPLFVNVRVQWPGIVPTSLEVAIDLKECLDALYYRVRARSSSGYGPWSNTQRQGFPKGHFLSCVSAVLDPPVLNAPLDQNGRVALSWSAVDGADSYVLETSADPSLDLGSVVFTGNQLQFTIWKSGETLSFFRVRAVRNAISGPWSNTTWTQPAPLPSWQLKDETLDTVAARMLSIHQAMLRMGAARGDLFVLLSLPETWRQTEALAYKSALRTAQSGPDEERSLSFGAMYHPWLVASEYEGTPEASIRYVNPDGAICGMFAARTLAVGAWVAAANQPLRSVVALEPDLGRGAGLDFYNAQVNLIRSDPRGFLVMSSDTLSPDADLRAINVRRLLILLRRVAMREGARLVFEPNDRAFQRRIQRQFEQLLSGLYVRGAFAGNTSEEAYRVITGASVNTQESMDQGRFIVELRVAPSLPLAFLTVRLVQTGAEILLKEIP